MKTVHFKGPYFASWFDCPLFNFWLELARELKEPKLGNSWLEMMACAVMVVLIGPLDSLSVLTIYQYSWLQARRICSYFKAFSFISTFVDWCVSLSGPHQDFETRPMDQIFRHPYSNWTSYLSKAFFISNDCPTSFWMESDFIMLPVLAAYYCL